MTEPMSSTQIDEITKAITSSLEDDSFHRFVPSMRSDAYMTIFGEEEELSVAIWTGKCGIYTLYMPNTTSMKGMIHISTPPQVILDLVDLNLNF